MAYGTMLADTFQSSAANTAPVIKDGNSTEIGQFTKSWIQFNGSTSTVAASFNVSGITKAATGDYTINFTNSLVDAKWSGGGLNDFTTAFIITTNSTSAVPAAGSARINSRTSAAGAADSAYIMLTINR